MEPGSTRDADEEALRETNDLLTLFIRRSPIYAFLKDVTPTESRVLLASDNFLQMVGIPGREMDGKTMQELFPPELAATMTADDWRVASGDAPVELEEEFGGRRYQTLKFPVVLGEKRRLAGYTIDITEQRREEAALRSSEMRLRAVFENVHQSFVLLDPDRTIRFFNRAASDAAASVSGRPLQLGESIDSWIPVAERSDFARTVKRSLAGELARTERRYPSATGDRSFEVQFAPIRADDGTVAGVFYSGQEVTERVRAEEERRSLEQQLGRIRRHQSLEQMAGGIAHQFNNLLAAIQGNLELARPHADAEVAPLLAEAADAVRRAAVISGGMLTYLGQGALLRVPRRLSQELEDALPGLRAALPGGTRLEIAIGSDLPWCTVDRTGLRTLLLNLVLNAAEAVEPQRGTVRLTARRLRAEEVAATPELLERPGGAWTRLEVRDDGPGMSPQTLERAFDPFFSTKFTGRGLGLSVVEGLVRAHGGAVHLESGAGLGTTARVDLPESLPEELAAAGGGVGNPEPRHSPRRTPGPGAVLVVDDDAPVLRAHRRLLRQLGHEVLAATSGAEALAHLEGGGPSIGSVVLDLNMPDLDGWAVLAALRRRRPDLYVVLASGYDVAQLRREPREVEPDAWLQKPFGVEELAAVLAIRAPLRTP